MAEKVVKPPRKPVPQNALGRNQPIRNAPSTLMVRIGQAESPSHNVSARRTHTPNVAPAPTPSPWMSFCMLNHTTP